MDDWVSSCRKVEVAETRCERRNRKTEGVWIRTLK